MADGVLFFLGHLGESQLASFWHEERVVAETSISVELGENLAIHTTFEICGGVAFDECDDGSEVSTSVGLSLHLAQELGVVGSTVVAFLRGIAGGEDARRAVESRHLQTAVVGEAVEAVVFLHELGFLQRVLLECVPRLRYVGTASDVIEAADIVFLAEHGAHLLELVRVVRGEDDGFLLAHFLYFHLVESLTVHSLHIGHGQEGIRVNLLDQSENLDRIALLHEAYQHLALRLGVPSLSIEYGHSPTRRVERIGNLGVVA